MSIERRTSEKPSLASGIGEKVPAFSRILPMIAIITAVPVAVVAAEAASRVGGGNFTYLMLFGGVCLTIGFFTLKSPVFACITLLITIFLRVALPPLLPVDVFLVAFAGMIASVTIWMHSTPDRLRGISALEWVMGLYLLWNLYSMLAPHEYPAIAPLTGHTYSVPRMILIGTLIPFAMFVVGRYTIVTRVAVRALLWTILAISAYSAFVSIAPFTGPTSVVWPRYIVEAPAWPMRAVGVFNQPVVNGFVLVLGFAVAMLLVVSPYETRWRRLIILVVAAGCGYGIFLTHTRAVWLGCAVVLVIGILFAQGFRTGFVVSAGIAASVIALKWSVFVSTDRASGGVGSVSEVEGRLNAMETALWAARQKPLAGWGVGRFQAVNTYHHQQWSPDVPWGRGLGIVSHQNELGILGELGIVGLVLWIAVLTLLLYRLVDAHRTLPTGDVYGKPLALLAIMAFALLITTGMTVDVRFFDFPGAAAFLLAGIAVGRSDRLKQRLAECPGNAEFVASSQRSHT